MVRERFPGIRHNLLRRCEQLSFAPMFAASDIAAARSNLRSVGKAAPAVADSPGADEIRPAALHDVLPNAISAVPPSEAVSAVPAPVPGGDIIASEPVGPPMVTSAPAPVTVLREAVNLQFGHITHTSVRVTFNQDRSIPGTKNIMEICEYTLFALRGVEFTVAALDVEDNDYVFTGLNASTTYRIRITTVAVGHPLRHSAVVSVKTQAAPAAAASSTTAPQVLKPEVPQLTKPGKPVARLDNRTSTELTFDFPASQLTAKDGALFNSAMSSMYTVEYKAEYGYSSMLSFLSAWMTGPEHITGTSLTLTGLTPGTKYYVRLTSRVIRRDSGEAVPGAEPQTSDCSDTVYTLTKAEEAALTASAGADAPPAGKATVAGGAGEPGMNEGDLM